LWRETIELEFLVHFIFDDHDFGQSERLIGAILLNRQEAEAISVFVAQLDLAIGPRSKPLSAVNESDWSPVARAASDALTALAVAGLPFNG